MKRISLVAASIVALLFCLCLSVLLVGRSPVPVVAATTTLETRVKTLEQNQTALLKRVAVLETAIASQTHTTPATAQPVLVATATPAQAPKYDYELVSIQDKIVESNNVFDKRAWIMVIKNNTAQTLMFNATVEFLDASGFIVDQDIKFGLIIGPNETKQYTGVKLVNAAASATVAKLAVESNITARQ